LNNNTRNTLFFVAIIIAFRVASIVRACNYENNVYFEGTIYEKFVDSMHKNRHYIYLQINRDSFSKYPIDVPDLYTAISPGDTIIKKRGTVKNILIKNKDSVAFYADY